MDFLNEVGDCWRVLSRGRLDPLSIFQRVHSILGENTNGNGGSRNVNSETIKKKTKKIIAMGHEREVDLDQNIY